MKIALFVFISLLCLLPSSTTGEDVGQIFHKAVHAVKNWGANGGLDQVKGDIRNFDLDQAKGIIEDKLKSANLEQEIDKLSKNPDKTLSKLKDSASKVVDKAADGLRHKPLDLFKLGHFLDNANKKAHELSNSLSDEKLNELKHKVESFFNDIKSSKEVKNQVEDFKNLLEAKSRQLVDEVKELKTTGELRHIAISIKKFAVDVERKVEDNARARGIAIPSLRDLKDELKNKIVDLENRLERLRANGHLEQAEDAVRTFVSQLKDRVTTALDRAEILDKLEELGSTTLYTWEKFVNKVGLNKVATVYQKCFSAVQQTLYKFRNELKTVEIGAKKALQVLTDRVEQLKNVVIKEIDTLPDLPELRSLTVSAKAQLVHEIKVLKSTIKSLGNKFNFGSPTLFYIVASQIDEVRSMFRNDKQQSIYYIGYFANQIELMSYKFNSVELELLRAKLQEWKQDVANPFVPGTKLSLDQSSDNGNELQWLIVGISVAAVVIVAVVIVVVVLIVKRNKTSYEALPKEEIVDL